jgi:hypothetical protein
MSKNKACDNTLWKQCKLDKKRNKHREYIPKCTYYDANADIIRIGNDNAEVGRPCASPLELTDEMKNKIRAKKSEKNIEKNN